MAGATTHDVHLAIYDLSQGMARSLSAQFLGPDHVIDLIPHTGIVVFGKEYFFGGGIQSANPESFRRSQGIYPINTQLLGQTTVSQTVFEQWCRECMQTGRYSIDAYDLITRNCNNFCNDAATEGLRLPQGVPEWILDVPRRFLASPMGQIVRPMLEQMQVTGPGGGGGSAAPFADTAPSLAPLPVVASPTRAAPTVDPNVNPWANLPAHGGSTAPAATNSKPKPDTQTPVLDSLDRPLLSNDTKTASLCATKLIAQAQDENDKTVLKDMSDVLSSGGAKPTEALVEASCNAILKQLQDETNSSATFAFMFLRLIVLHPPASISETSAFIQCLQWLQQQLDQSGSLQSHAARSMAWCTLSNAYGASSTCIPELDQNVEAALGDMSPECRVEVRQAAAAFVYNISLVQGSLSQDCEDLPDLAVSLLCGCLEGIALETDDTTKLRRLLVAGHIVKPSSSKINESARSLVNDLGFDHTLHEVVASGSTPKAGGDADKVQKLTKELIDILDS